MPVVEFEIQGPDAPPKKVRRSLDSEPLWIGRDDSCQLVLPAGSVSRRHVALRWRGDQLEVTDFSSNGTLVNDTLLRKASRRFPASGVRLVLGPFALRIRVVDGLPDAASNIDRNSATPAPRNLPDRPSGAPAEAKHKAVEHATSPLLRRRIHRQLMDHLDLPKMDGKLLNDPTLRDRVIVALRRIVVELDKEIPAAADRETLILELTNEALGLGPLEALLDDPDVSEIMVVDPQTIFAERRGKIVYTGARFTDNESVRAAIERIVTPLGRRIDESTPLVDARLKDGSRVNAVIPPLAVKGPCITIRKFAKTPLVIEDLIRFGSMTPRLARFLTRAVRIRKNIIISGGTGSGKTTLLNVLSGAIPEEERVVTIEDAAELQLAQPHVVSLESRPPNLEGKGCACGPIGLWSASAVAAKQLTCSRR
jgi:pilus assembly protein CpaF